MISSSLTSVTLRGFYTVAKTTPNDRSCKNPRALLRRQSRRHRLAGSFLGPKARRFSRGRGGFPVLRARRSLARGSSAPPGRERRKRRGREAAFGEKSGLPPRDLRRLRSCGRSGTTGRMASRAFAKAPRGGAGGGGAPPALRAPRRPPGGGGGG